MNLNKKGEEKEKVSWKQVWARGRKKAILSGSKHVITQKKSFELVLLLSSE